MPLRDIPACLRARLSRLIALQSRDREGAGFDTGCQVDFMLDVTRATIRLTKATYQNRARQAIILMRLDLDGPPHSNPDALPSIGNYPWLEPYKGKTVPRISTATWRISGTSGPSRRPLIDTRMYKSYIPLLRL
jgi:hypothetical protein